VPCTVKRKIERWRRGVHNKETAVTAKAGTVKEKRGYAGIDVAARPRWLLPKLGRKMAGECTAALSISAGGDLSHSRLPHASSAVCWLAEKLLNGKLDSLVE
jgi:hypothetical protein